MPLGNWYTGLEQLLGIIKLSFTSLHTYIKTKKSDPGKMNKSSMSLDLTHSSLSSLGSSYGVDHIQSSFESKICVPVSILDTYLSVAPAQPGGADKERLLKECQDIVSALLQLPISIESVLIAKVTDVYSKHFHLFYKSPQHIWAAFLSFSESYTVNLCCKLEGGGVNCNFRIFLLRGTVIGAPFTRCNFQIHLKCSNNLLY